jgi:hypothetical protein
VKHEKKTFFSLLKNTRSEGIGQGRPKGAAAAGGAKRRAFTDAAAVGTPRQRRESLICHDSPRTTTIKADFD